MLGPIDSYETGLGDITLGVEMDVGHATNKIIAKVEGVDNNIE